MVQVKVTDEIRSNLLNLSVPLELYDENGYLFGRILPASASEQNSESAESETNGEVRDT